MKHQMKMKWTGLLAALPFLVAACNAAPFVQATSEPTPLPLVVDEGVASTEGRLVPLRSSELAYLNGGELGELLVNEGDQVAEGDALAHLAQREQLEAALSQAQLELVSAQQELDSLNETAGLSREQSRQAWLEARTALNQAQIALNDLDTEETQQELDDLNMEVQDARDELDDAEEELERVQDLDPDNAAREDAQTAYDDAQRAYNQAVYDRDALRNELDQARQAVDMAEASVEDAQRAVDERSDGPDPDELALAEARLAAAEAQVAAAQSSLDQSRLIAPYPATVVDLHDLEPGEILAPRQTVVTLADFSAWRVETSDLTELDVVNVEPGQQVRVAPDALPDLELIGVVESISQNYTERSGDILYTVRIRLEESDPRLRWGMTVNAVFED